MKKLDLVTDDIVISGDEQNIGVARFKGEETLSKAKVAEVKAHFSEEWDADTNISSCYTNSRKRNCQKRLIGIADYFAWLNNFRIVPL